MVIVKGKVGILTSNFFSPDGERLINGGAERYGFRLTDLLLALGYEVEWWQVGSGWERELCDGVKVKSIRVEESPYETMPRLNQGFQERAVDVDYSIYFITFLAYPQVKRKSISISHGIYWDYPLFEDIVGGGKEKEEWRRRLRIALGGPERIVSVDTATIEWVKATWTGLEHKFEYIPNFVDKDLFNCQGRDKILAGRPTRVIFPRRITSVRGINETVRAAEVITEEREDLEFHIVGRAHEDSLEGEMMRWASKRKRVYYYWQAPERMADIYRQMDIALIPSRATEGTSLSCLEAMACGCAVVSSYVGGLSDLIIDGYNGLLIRPDSEEIISSLNYLLENPRVAEKLAARGSEVARSFSLQHWREQWTEVISGVFT